VVETHRKQGVALDCFGIGWEGLNDDLLEVLSRNGDGRYGFINSPTEAATEFAAQLAGALQVAASDVKVQVEFNPAVIAQYRLIGYENRALREEDFDNDRVDAGDIGAGHQVTAIYEVVPVGGKGWIAPRRYEDAPAEAAAARDFAPENLARLQRLRG
jgi:Ca-activated chloride channel family protein